MTLRDTPVTEHKVSAVPLPSRHPAIFPHALPKAVRLSSMPCFLNHSATPPSKKPAMASVMASPTTAPTIAPATPNPAAPASAASVRSPVSMAPKMMSGRSLFNASPASFPPARGRRTIAVTKGPYNRPTVRTPYAEPTRRRLRTITIENAFNMFAPTLSSIRSSHTGLRIRFGSEYCRPWSPVSSAAVRTDCNLCPWAGIVSAESGHPWVVSARVYAPYLIVM